MVVVTEVMQGEVGTEVVWWCGGGCGWEWGWVGGVGGEWEGGRGGVGCVMLISCQRSFQVLEKNVLYSNVMILLYLLILRILGSLNNNLA